jgi:epoxide hydrolase 4
VDLDTDLAHRFAVVDGVRLHYVEAGPEDGPLVVLLHGFPEFWWAWRRQIPALVAAGYRVIAPDQRGYARSDQPRAVRDYSLERLSADVAGLIAAVGAERAFVAGHDWGAVVAWGVATLYPERVERVAILNVPHPDTMQRTLQRSFQQVRKSWYMFFFQIPWLPERMLARGGKDTLARVYSDARAGACTDDDLAKYAEAFRGPGAWRGPINWYRAALRRSPRKTRALYRPIPAEVLVIWGMQDAFLGAEMAESDPVLVPHVRIERLPDASHWVQHDEPERVNTLLTSFFSGA